MAITKQEVQITWPTAVNSKSVASGATQDSEATTIHATATGGQVALKADNNGTPASGDTVDFYIKYNCGDPDAEPGTDEFATDDHAILLAQLDTYASGSGDDPAVAVVSIDVDAKEFKIFVKSNAATNGITVSATYYETRAA
ncbi:MAG: hypothetical protein ACE5FA_06290 [Dehalococcoidia bacterium]